jgi:hypothetical protein
LSCAERRKAARPASRQSFPPSTHVSGEPIRFEPGGRPEPARVSAAELERAVAKRAAAALLARHFAGEGSRNKAFLALAACWREAAGARPRRRNSRARSTGLLVGRAADLRQAEAEVAHTFERFREGGEVTGLPTLIELIPEKVVKTAMRWLGVEAGTAPRVERVIQPGDDSRVELEVTVGRMAELAEQAEAVLAQAPDCDLYQSGGRIVFPAREAGADGTASHALVTADENALALRLSERIRFVKRAVVRNMPVTVDVEVPRQLPAFMLARRGRWTYRYLRGVVSVPVIRSDGSIAAREGYDASTGLLLANLPDDLQVPEHPTPADAVQALRTLCELLRGFPFESETDATAALSALMSAVLRPSLGPVPLHLFTAPVAGSGKTYLFEIAGALATGMRPPVLAAAGLNAEELDKRLAAALLAGRPIVCLDNLEGMLQSSLLCQAVASAAPVEVRRLGTTTRRRSNRWRHTSRPATTLWLPATCSGAWFRCDSIRAVNARSFGRLNSIRCALSFRTAAATCRPASPFRSPTARLACRTSCRRWRASSDGATWYGARCIG